MFLIAGKTKQYSQITIFILHVQNTAEEQLA